MKVLIFGAAGKTGSLVVDRALAAGHEVTVLVHDASKFAEHRDPASRGIDRRVAVFTGDATNPTDVRAAITTAALDAVVFVCDVKNPVAEISTNTIRIRGPKSSLCMSAV